MKLKNIKDIIDVDWPEPKEITEKTREISYKMAQRGYRADSRTAMGRIYTSQEMEKRRKNSELP